MRTQLWHHWKKCRNRNKRNTRIHSASTVASTFVGFKSSWLKGVGILQNKVYKTCMADLDDLKHRIKTEWAKLNHAVIAAAVHRWRRRLSGSQRAKKAGDGHFRTLYSSRLYLCSDNCYISYCRWSVKQLHANRPVWLIICSWSVMTSCFAIHGDCLIRKVK